MDLSAVILVPALAGAAVLTFACLLFTAHYYLTVMESTGVGAREVTWMGEPILDNAWKVAYQGWLAGIWLGPAYLISRKLTAGIDTGWIKLAVPVFIFWVCYPISQLSSLSATSIWLPLVPDVFARLIQKPFVTLGFYLLTIPVLLLLAVAFKWAFLTAGEFHLLILGAPLMVTALLLYARLLGRLAFALRFTKDLLAVKKKPEAKKRPAADSPLEDNSEPREGAFTQPSELPPLLTPHDGELSGYDVKLTDEPVLRPRKRVKAEVVELEVVDTGSEEGTTGEAQVGPSTKHPEKASDFAAKVDAYQVDAYQVEAGEDRSRDRVPHLRQHSERAGSSKHDRPWDEDDNDKKAYEVRDAEVQVDERRPSNVIQPSEEELRLLRRDDVAKRPSRVWSPDLLAFLPQSGTIMAILIASFFCLGAGGMVRIARMFWPSGGPE